MDETPEHTTDRRGLAVLSPAECHDLLDGEPVGRVAFLSSGTPLVLPVNYALDDTSIVFRTTVGEKLAAADRREQMAFEIDGWDVETQTGWSVVVRGTAERVFDDEEIARLEGLGVTSWAKPGLRARWIRLRPSEITGRAVR